MCTRLSIEAISNSGLRVIGEHQIWKSSMRSKWTAQRAGAGWLAGRNDYIETRGSHHSSGILAIHWGFGACGADAQPHPMDRIAAAICVSSFLILWPSSNTRYRLQGYKLFVHGMASCMFLPAKLQQIGHRTRAVKEQQHSVKYQL